MTAHPAYRAFAAMAAEREPGTDLPAYAWPGGYPIRYYAEEGDQYCPKCASQDDADPAIVAAEVAWEGPDDFCDGCGAILPTAYGDPDAEQVPS